MKVYAFGEETAPVILLLPGTCCHWKGNFGHVIPLLSDEYRVLCVSYDGFDETERTEFPTMLEETAKIEDYLKANCVGHIRAAYGCSLGGSFVGLLAARGNIRMDYGILGSSDLDQSSKFAAKLQTNLLLSLMFPMLRDGRFKSPLLQKRVEKQMRQMGDYGVADTRRGAALFDAAKLQKSVLFRSCHAAARQARRAGDGNSYLLRAQDGRKVPRPLRAALRTPHYP